MSEFNISDKPVRKYQTIIQSLLELLAEKAPGVKVDPKTLEAYYLSKIKALPDASDIPDGGFPVVEDGEWTVQLIKDFVDGYHLDVEGATVEIEPVNNTTYHCGELEQLTISNPPSTGAYIIIFTSGSTPTTTTVPSTILGLEDFAADADTIYEINVLDNRAVVGMWVVTT